MDLSQLYGDLNAIQTTPVPGGGVPGAGDPAAGDPAAPPGLDPEIWGPAPGGQTPPPPFNVPPEWGLGDPTGANPQQVQDYYGAVNTGLLAGTYTPYEWAATARGQNAENRPYAYDGSPEANLTGMQWAGTTGASALTREQAASIKYNTPEYQQFLADRDAPPAPGNPSNFRNEFTGNVLNNALLGGAYAGDQADLESAIVQSHLGQYQKMQQMIGPSFTWEQYVRNVTPQVRDTLERATGLATTTGNTQALMPPSTYGGPQAGYYTNNAGTTQTPTMDQIRANTAAVGQQGTTSIRIGPNGQMAPPPPPAPTLVGPGHAIAGGTGNAPMTQDANGQWQLPPGYQSGSASLNSPASQAAGALAASTAPKITPPPAPAGSPAPKAPPSGNFVEKNMAYEQAILKVPEAQRTQAQKDSLAASQAKLAPYR
jgi:hypothetical protein